MVFTIQLLHAVTPRVAGSDNKVGSRVVEIEIED